MRRGRWWRIDKVMEFLDAEEAGELGLAVAHGQVGGHHKLVMLRTRATKDDVLIVSGIA